MRMNILNPFRFSEKIKDRWFRITYSNQFFLRKAVKNKYKKRSYVLLVALVSCVTLLIKSCKSYTDFPKKQYEKAIQQTPFDAIIVPGFPFENDSWSTIMKIRVLWSIHLYKSGMTKKIIYSGGAVYSPYYESKIMQLYAQKLGVPASDILIETKAQYSSENLYYSHQLALANGLNKIAVATDPIQGQKLKKYARKFDLEIDFLPIIYDTVKRMDTLALIIEPGSAFDTNFIHIQEKQTLYQRWRGSRGKLIE